VVNVRQSMDNKYDWETLKAIKEDLSYIKISIHCFVKGHDYVPDEVGYICQKCYWMCATDLELDTWEEYYEARPSKWTYGG
jgi:hypothetical protein